MKNILDIYSEYTLMQNLQEHQLRVAGVAMQLCDSLDIPVDKDAILVACLLHDMGNIIKFKLDYFPEFLQPQGMKYWEKIKREYIEKYGADEHTANLMIARELGVSELVLSCIDAIGFPNWHNTAHAGNLEQKICTYADTRVAPYGVVSLTERLIEGTKRYVGDESAEDENQKMLHTAVYEIEKQLFAHSNIKPEDITDASIAPYIEKLKDFSL